jgi:hypothetical protein
MQQITLFLEESEFSFMQQIIHFLEESVGARGSYSKCIKETNKEQKVQLQTS